MAIKGLAAAASAALKGVGKANLPRFNKALAQQRAEMNNVGVNPKLGNAHQLIAAGVGRGPNTVSFGAHIGPVGGSVGMSGGKPFVTGHIGQKIKGRLGPKKGVLWGQ